MCAYCPAVICFTAEISSLADASTSSNGVGTVIRNETLYTADNALDGELPNYDIGGSHHFSLFNPLSYNK
jgi:hypothetical protein